MRILVCGGRDYGVPKKLEEPFLGRANLEKDHIFEVLDLIHKATPLDVLIQGEARGADLLAKLWAKTNKVECLGFIPDWDRYGKAAGAIRNKTMLVIGKPDLVVAFPGGKGTQNMISIARKAGVKLRIEGPVWATPKMI